MIMEEEGVELKFERGNWLGWLPCTGFAWCNPCSAQKLFTLPVHHWHSPWLVDRVPAGHGGVGGGLLQTFPSRYSSWLPQKNFKPLYAQYRRYKIESSIDVTQGLPRQPAPTPAPGLLEAGKDRISSEVLGGGTWLAHPQTLDVLIMDIDVPDRPIRLGVNQIDLSSDQMATGSKVQDAVTFRGNLQRRVWRSHPVQ